jgi:polyisoprenoid-binding protein YceI
MSTIVTPAPRILPEQPAHKRHWIRWILTGIAVLVVLLLAFVVLYVKFAPVPAPLGLPSTPASAPTGPVEGTWTVGAVSEAGFRIQQTVLFASSDVVERTTAVHGTLTVSGNEITAATFRVDLTAITHDGKTTPQLTTSLDTARHPEATVTLTRPVTLDPAFISGGTVTATVTGELTLRGVAHPVTFTVTARRDGTALQATGTIPVAFADWDIPSPTGYGSLGSLADHGVAEFFLVLRRP